MKTTAARLRDEGRAEGRTQGRAELLEQQLVARFGPLPLETASRIQSAARAEVDRWAIAVLKAASLEDVFAAD